MLNRQKGEPETLAGDLLTALSGERLGFHMPGHVSGRGLPPWLMAELGRLDTTELPHTDNLSCPSGMLRLALTRAAQTFGAARTHFLVNGATGGLLAAVHALVGPGDVLLVGRDCHRSALQAARLAGAIVVFVSGAVPDAAPLPCGPAESDWLQALEAHPEAKALLLTRPNYYGTAVSLRRIVRAAHDAGMGVLVDEAHGAHFVAGAAFPETALACGADLVVQSLHKTLPAPTQTALLHESVGWNGVRPGLPVSSVGEAVTLFQTTSPSWMLLCLMDAAIGWFSQAGAEMYASLLERLHAFRVPEPVAHAVRRLSLADAAEGFALDPTRLVLWMPQAGTALAEALWARHGIAVEMADLDRVVLIVTPFHTTDALERLKEGLLDVVPLVLQGKGEKGQNCATPRSVTAGIDSSGERTAFPGRPDSPLAGPVSSSGKQVTGGIPMSDAVRQPRTSVPLTQAAGRLAATPIVPYPPGVAILVPGECFDETIIAHIIQLLEAGVVVHGVDNSRVQVV